MLNFGKVSFNDFANSTAIYKNAGYQTYYNFVTKDLQTFYTSDSQEFLVADENSYSPNAIVEITAPSDAEIINFYTPAVFNKDDVYRVNGVVAQVVNLNGEKVLSGWSAGVPITLIYKDNKLFYDIGSGAPTVPTNTLFLDGETVEFDSTSLDATNLVRTMSVKANPQDPGADKQFAVTKNGHVFMVHNQGILEYDVAGSFVKKHIIETGVVGYPCNIVSDGQETLYVCTNRCYILKVDSVTGNIANKPLMRAGDVTAIGWQPTLEYDNGYIYTYPESTWSASSVFIEKINATDMSSIERKEIPLYTPEVGDPTFILIELTGKESPAISRTFCECAYFDGKIYAIIDGVSSSNKDVPLPGISHPTKFSVSNQNGNLVADIFCSLDRMVRYNLNTKEKLAQITFPFSGISNFNMSFEKVGDVIYLLDMASSLQPKAPEATSNDAYMVISAYIQDGRNTRVSGDEGYVKIKEIPITVGENTFVYNTISSSRNTLFLYKAIRRNEVEGQPAIMDSFIGYTIPYRLNNSNTEYEIYKDLKYSNKTIIKNGITSAKAGNTVEFSLDKSFFQSNPVKPIIFTISGKRVDFTTKVSGSSSTNGEYSFVVPSEDVIISKETYAGGSN